MVAAGAALVLAAVEPVDTLAPVELGARSALVASTRPPRWWRRIPQKPPAQSAGGTGHPLPYEYHS